MKASLRDMIRINRNHPSIIVWSMDNEVFFSEPFSDAEGAELS